LEVVNEPRNRGVARHERVHGDDFDHPLREALDARAFWRTAVLSDPDAGYAILDARGRFLSVNDIAADALLGVHGAPLLGLTLHDVLPREIAAERTSFLQRVLRSERPMLVTSVWRGVRCRERWQLLPGDAGLSGQVLWILHRSPVPWPAPVDVSIHSQRARWNDWGPLAPLTEGERSLLGLIGRGLSSEEIARRTGRPLGEVLREKGAIRRKLGGAATATMVRLAVLAGLVEPAPG
jgi:DNA-binding CsgD family transcriptional regulator